MERRLRHVEILYQRHAPQHPPRPLLDLRDLSVDERLELYDLTDRVRTAAEELRYRALWSRVKEAV